MTVLWRCCGCKHFFSSVATKARKCCSDMFWRGTFVAIVFALSSFCDVLSTLPTRSHQLFVESNRSSFRGSEAEKVHFVSNGFQCTQLWANAWNNCLLNACVSLITNFAFYFVLCCLGSSFFFLCDVLVSCYQAPFFLNKSWHCVISKNWNCVLCKNSTTQ